MKHYIAGDLGAESGRVMLGSLLPQGVVELREIHRFLNGPIELCGQLRWNLLGIYAELKAGLAKLATEKITPKGFSVDSWGVDYVWFKSSEPMLSLPYHYRDGRTDATFAELTERVGKKLIFEETGIQFMSLNTLYQFAADVASNSSAMNSADQFLCIADYLNFLFSGVAAEEVSLASTTQVFNPTTMTWSKELIEKVGMPAKVFPKVCASGTVLGPIRPEIAAETGIDPVQVVATCSHDTGAAVAAVPAGETEDWAYLSSGTWSLMGVELSSPLISEQVLEKNFTNEVGASNTIRFLKNIVGLWILQESRRHWAREGVDYDYSALTRMAEQTDPFLAFIDPANPPFLKPGEMPTKILDFLERTGQPKPKTHGGYVRIICESLALSYRKTLEEIESLTGRKINTIHVVGGGSKNRLLNQLTADATGRRVVAGPVEATAVGNVLLQALALGDLPNLAALRTVVRNSFELDEFTPSNDPRWVEAYSRFLSISSTKN